MRVGELCSSCSEYEKWGNMFGNIEAEEGGEPEDCVDKGG